MLTCCITHCQRQSGLPVLCIKHTVRDTENLTFSAGIPAFPLLAYADVSKESHSYFVLFYAGVASCVYDLRADL